MVFISGSLLFLPLSGYAAISATTSKTIQGTEPYFTWNNTKITTFDNLLGFRYIATGGGTATATPSNTTITVNASMKENDIETLISGVWSKLSLTSTSTLSNTLVQSGDLKVKDADGDDTAGISALGTIKATLTKDGSKITPTANTFDICSTYQLTIEVVPTTTGGAIAATTSFGDPKVGSYNSQSVTYTLGPAATASTTTVRFAKPNLTNGTGLNTHWNTTNGFIPQDVSDPSKNFPTTGFNGAFFDVKLSTGAASQVIGCKNAGGNPDVTMTLTANPGGAGADVLRVTLDGPNNRNNILPTGPHKATIFRLKLGSTDIYSFNVSKWFIASYNTGIQYAGSSTANAFCSGLESTGGYYVPSINDYSNNPLGYTRAIGGGLFAEWGFTSNAFYTTGDFEHFPYWTSDTETFGDQYTSLSDTGNVIHFSPTDIYRTACVSP